MKAQDYPIIVFYSEDDEGYIADVPDFKYCSAFGNTPEEAIREVGIAMKLWLEAMEDNNKIIPEPLSHPELGALMAELTRWPEMDDDFDDEDEEEEVGVDLSVSGKPR